MTPEEKLHPLVELTLARMREFWREPEAIFWVFVFPVLLAFALGIAFRNTAPGKLRVAVEDQNPGSSAVAAALSHSGELEAVVLPPGEAARALRTGKVTLVVRAVDDMAADKPARGVAAVHQFVYRYDPTLPESRMARLEVDNALEAALGRVDLSRVHEERVTEPGARYIDFLIPGLIGLNLMGSGMWGLGFTVVQARTRKLLKRLMATPMRRSHFLLSFMLSRLVFLIGEVVAVVGFAWLVFGVKVRGSWADLAVLSLLGALTFGGLGLLVASRARTIEGVSGLMNLVMLPMWLLSGTFFSAERFPRFAQPFIKALPLTALNDALRTVMNDGARLASSSSEIGVMLVWGLVSFAVALRIFRWQ